MKFISTLFLFLTSFGLYAQKDSYIRLGLGNDIFSMEYETSQNLYTFKSSQGGYWHLAGSDKGFYDGFRLTVNIPTDLFLGEGSQFLFASSYHTGSFEFYGAYHSLVGFDSNIASIATIEDFKVTNIGGGVRYFFIKDYQTGSQSQDFYANIYNQQEYWHFSPYIGGDYYHLRIRNFPRANLAIQEQNSGNNSFSGFDFMKSHSGSLYAGLAALFVYRPFWMEGRFSAGGNYHGGQTRISGLEERFSDWQNRLGVSIHMGFTYHDHILGLDFKVENTEFKFEDKKEILRRNIIGLLLYWSHVF